MTQKTIDLFLVDKEGILTINKVEVRGISSLKKILERDKGGKIYGDADGRKKYVAYKEYAFIYFMYSPYSIFCDLDIVTRREKVLSKLDGIYEGWKEDEDLKEAIKTYKECINSSAIFNAYTNASITLYGVGEDLKFFNNRAKYLRDKIKIKQHLIETSKLDEDVEIANQELGELTNQLLDLSKRVQGITEKLPTSFDNLKVLYDKIKEEQAATQKLYGGGELGNREQ